MAFLSENLPDNTFLPVKYKITLNLVNETGIAIIGILNQYDINLLKYSSWANVSDDMQGPSDITSSTY